MINPELLDNILLEWSYRLKDGIPDVNDPEKVKVLNQVLAENKLPLYEGADIANESEGMVVYFSALSKKDLDIIEENFKLIVEGKKYKPTKLDISSIKPEYYGQAVGSVKNLVELYNKGGVTKNNISRYLNSLSMARYIHSNINTSGNVICDRGVLFSTIKEQAHKIGKKLGFADLKADKWSPADIFVYAGGNDPDLSKSKIDKIEQINVKVGDDPTLNELFIDSFSTPGSKKILGISLKEAKAQGGKAKSFSKTLIRGTDFPEDAGALTKEQSLQKDISFYLDYILDNFDSKNEADRTNCISYAIRCKSLLNSAGSPNVLVKIKNDLDVFLKNAIGPKNINLKDDAAKIEYKKNPKSISIPKSLELNIKAMYSEVLDEAYKFYSNSRENLFAELEGTGNYTISDKSKQISKTDISSPQTLIKKGACYQVAQELILGLNLKEFSMPEAYTNIAEDTNVFVALTAFAIGYTGLSPTFFKLVGSDKLGGNAHAEKFDGAGTLVLSDDTTIEIIDSPTYKGFQTKFVVDVEIKGATTKSYEILLSFRYSDITISIESAAPKEKK